LQYAQYKPVISINTDLSPDERCQHLLSKSLSKHKQTYFLCFATVKYLLYLHKSTKADFCMLAAFGLRY